MSIRIRPRHIAHSHITHSHIAHSHIAYATSPHMYLLLLLVSLDLFL